MIVEHATVRKDCVIIDRPDRAVIEVSGSDALEFLGRMLTNDVAALAPGQSCNSFWLNRKGRIDADLRVMRLGEADGKPARFFLDLERGSLELALKTLGAYIITEDVELRPRHGLHRLSVHGPRGHDLLREASESRADPRTLDMDRNIGDCLPDGVRCEIDRHDTAGVPGYELFVERERAAEVYQHLLRVGRPDFPRSDPNAADPGARGEALAASKAGTSPGDAVGIDRPRPESIRLRPCGWFAFNIARIEAGTPLFRIDFGPDNLPAETGVLDDRVNFKKGCYLGQEVVARMHARGHPKQRLVALRFDDDLMPGPDGLPPLPVQGDRVLAVDAEATAVARPIGSITSSTFSPMLGRIPVAFAMLGWAQVDAGTRVRVECEGGPIGATVQEGLRLVP